MHCLPGASVVFAHKHSSDFHEANSWVERDIVGIDSYTRDNIGISVVVDFTVLLDLRYGTVSSCQLVIPYINVSMDT